MYKLKGTQTCPVTPVNGRKRQKGNCPLKSTYIEWLFLLQSWRHFTSFLAQFPLCICMKLLAELRPSTVLQIMHRSITTTIHLTYVPKHLAHRYNTQIHIDSSNVPAVNQVYKSKFKRV